MLPPSLRLLAKQSTRLSSTSSSRTFNLPASTFITRSYSQQYTSQASPLTPPSHLNDAERVGYNADKGTGNASLKRIDAIMGGLVAIGVVIAGWAYFRSSALKGQQKQVGGGKVEPKLV